MNYAEYLARTIYEHLAAGMPVVLASIISQQGSTPRNSGTKMVIGEDLKIYGTIGGGLLESDSIQESARVIAKKKSTFREFELNGTGVGSENMICGGKAAVLLDYIAPTSKNSSFFQSFNDAIAGGSDFYSVTYFGGKNDDLCLAGRSLFLPEGKMIGDSPLPASDVKKLESEMHNISTVEMLTFGDVKVVVDRIRRLKTLYCFGAGHVAVPTTHLASLVGFRVCVLDDRHEFASSSRFPDADRLAIIKDFEHAFEGLDIDSDSFIVILTRGHQFDSIVLEQALRTKAGYIGMISSQKKKEAIFQYLLGKGFTKQALARVHAPIGIIIGAQTPEEIAVSIVAELISLRSGITM